VLGAVMMLLQREPASRLHDDALDLVTISGVDRLIASPRAMLQESNLLEEMGDLQCGSVNEPQYAREKRLWSLHRKERRIPRAFACESNLD
jgi:hypothetical protein